MLRSFGYKFTDLVFTKSKNGKWLCDKCFFSISHSNGYVAVAVSNREVGIDVEEINAFVEKCNNDVLFDKMKRHIISKKEAPPQTPMQMLKMWTQKESLFKCRSKKSFNPSYELWFGFNPKNINSFSRLNIKLEFIELLRK